MEIRGKWKVEISSEECPYFEEGDCIHEDNITAFRYLPGVCIKKSCPVKIEEDNK